MPRTNTKIDRDLEKTKEAVHSLDKALSGIENMIESARTANELRTVHHQELLERLELSQERLRQDHNAFRTSLTEWKTEFRELKRGARGNAEATLDTHLGGGVGDGGRPLWIGEGFHQRMASSTSSVHIGRSPTKSVSLKRVGHCDQPVDTVVRDRNGDEP
jgi:hypothetical protein